MSDPVKRYTVEEWLERSKELGYYITQQKIVEREVPTPKWKLVLIVSTTAFLTAGVLAMISPIYWDAYLACSQAGVWNEVWQ